MKSIVAVWVAVAIGWLCWPYYALYDLSRTLEHGDQVALESRVDWPRLRRGLQDDLKAHLATSLEQDDAMRGDPGAALGAGLVAMIGPALIDRLVDAYVTPAGIAALIQGQRQATELASTDEMPKAEGIDGGAKTATFNWDSVEYAFFDSPLTFRVTVAGASGEPVSFLMRWAGDWKLARIYLPM